MYLVSTTTHQPPPPSTMKNWGEIIRSRRRELNLSQEELALRMDVSQSFVSRIERGDRSPTTATFDRFTRFLSELRWSLNDFVEKTGLSVEGLEVPPPQLYANLITSPKSEQRLIPLYDISLPYALQSEPMGTIEIDVGDIGDFALRVNDVGISPLIQSGDILMVQKDVYEYGNTVVAEAQGEIIIRKLVSEDMAQLKKLSGKKPDYSIFFEKKVKIVGRVAWLRREFV